MKVALIAPAIRAEESYSNTSEYLFQKSGNNTGNFAFVQALYGHCAPNVEIYPWHASPEGIRRECDVVVMACANQLGPHTNLGVLADMLDKTGLPILAIGLGAQATTMDEKVALKEGTIRWLQVISAHAPTSAPNIGVRGEFSRQQLEHYGFAERAAITGCPSNLINSDPLLPMVLAQKYKSAGVERVAVPAGLPSWVRLQRIEEQLADLVDETHGLYIAQSEIDMVRLARGEFNKIAPSTFTEMHKYIRPKLTSEEFVLWCKRHATVYIDATSWLEAMRNFDLVVGPRFHGVMMAIQAGTPGGVIAHDSRTLEMCQTMAIPVRRFNELPDPVNRVNVASLFPFDAVAFARNRIELGRRYIGMLDNAGIKVNTKLASLLDNALPNQAS